MRLQGSVGALRPGRAAGAKRILGAALFLGLAVPMLGSPPALADEPDEAAQTAARESDAARPNDRQRRREERRRSREAESSQAAADAAENAESTFVVAVEPEIECRKVAVTGSRMAKEVCRPVGQAARNEENAQEFLRRMRELSTIVREEPQPNPLAHPGAL